LEKQNFTNSGWKRVLCLITAYFIFAGGFEIAGMYVAGLDFTKPSRNNTIEQDIITMAFRLSGTLILIALFLKFIDRKSLKELSLRTQHAGNDTRTGILIGLIIMLSGSVILLLTGQFQITGFLFDPYQLLLSILLFSMVSVKEEIFVRGYILQNLTRSFSKYIALLLSSLLFASLHMFNANLSTIGMISLVLAGLLLDLCYLRTRSLWLPIALHFSWNFFQCHLGFNISGIDQYSMISTTFHEGNNLERRQIRL
jgi:hypothetical protein